MLSPLIWFFSALVGPIMYVTLLTTKTTEFYYLLPALGMCLFLSKQDVFATSKLGPALSLKEESTEASKICVLCTSRSLSTSSKEFTVVTEDEVSHQHGLLDLDVPRRWVRHERVGFAVCSRCSVLETTRYLFVNAFWITLFLVLSILAAQSQGFLCLVAGFLAVACVVRIGRLIKDFDIDGGPISQAILDAQKARMGKSVGASRLFTDKRLSLIDGEGYDSHISDHELSRSTQLALVAYPTITAMCVMSVSILFTRVI